MKTAKRVAQRFSLRKAMSTSRAKEVLGFPPDYTPTMEEVQKAWKRETIKHHPDRGGDQQKMVEVNVAGEILTGKQSPKGEYRSPQPQKATETYVTFEEAASKASIPSGVQWLFVTSTHRGTRNYSGDTSSKNASGWVAFGRVEGDTYCCVSVENYRETSYYFGSPSGGYVSDIYTVKVDKVKLPELTPSVVYGSIVRAFGNFEHVDMKFNSKVHPAEGWTFSSRIPTSRPTTIKNWLVDSGAVAEQDLKVPRKFDIRIGYAKSFDSKPGYDQKLTSNYSSDWEKLFLVINGKEYDLPTNEARKLCGLRVGGKKFMERVFGEYFQGGEVKSLTKNRDGKAIMAWMAEKLVLTDSVKEILTRVSATS